MRHFLGDGRPSLSTKTQHPSDIMQGARLTVDLSSAFRRTYNGHSLSVTADSVSEGKGL